MNFEKQTVKQLQQLCKDANLRTTGKKKDLIERLEFHSAHNTVNDELMKRVRGLENTIMRLNGGAANETDDDVSQHISSEPQMTNFNPNSISSPQPLSTVVVASTSTNSAQRVNFSAPQVYTQMSVPQYAQGNRQQHISTSAPQHQPINVPNYTNMSAPHYTNVSAAQYAQVRAPQYVPVTAPQWAYVMPPPRYAAGIPHTIHAPNIEPMVTHIPTMCAQPTTFVAPPALNVTSTMSVKDIIMVLPDFDPTAQHSVSSKQFVQRVQVLKNAYHWQDDVLVFAVQQKLKGHAKYWIDALDEVFTNWQQLANKLIETFPFNDNAADAHVKMADTRRGVDETPQDYYYKMLALGKKYGMTDNAIARHIINGINEADLKRKISNEYSSCVELLHDIDSFCRFNKINNINQKTKYSSSSQFGQNQNGGKQTQDSKSFEKQNYQSSEGQRTKHIRCYNCSQYGHVSSKCPKPQRVPRCNNCSKHHQPSVECASIKQILNVKPVQKPELKKHVQINDWSGEAIIDSGSDRTLIRESLMESIGTALQCHIVLNGFGGGKYICTKSKKIEMLIDKIPHEVVVLAVPDKYLDTDVLLGRDALCQENTRVVIENDKCWVEGVKAVTSCVPELDSDEREKLMSLLAENRNCFAENALELGVCSIKRMEIKLTTNTPVRVKPYRIAFAKREEARNIVNELLCAGIIEHSDSTYASPVVMVPKKDGSLRLCVDYRLLNRITEKIPFPMPIMEEQFAMLAGNQYFSTMDLRMGYHQVEIHEESRKYTAFVTTDGHYQYTRMPFGLVNAPAIFQDIMNTVTSKFQQGEVLTYLDDMVIPSKTVDEGLKRLDKAFKVLREAGLTLRLDKCKFLASEISYLGHTITAAGMKPGNSKVSAIQKFNTPTSVTEVRRFLGLTGFFRKFIPNYAAITQPLTKLLHKVEEKNFIWGKEQTSSFERLIKLLCDKPVLALYIFNAHHEVHTDASAVGLAGVLLQSDDMKNWHAVFYYSRHCTDTEKRYHGYELEVLAAVETLNRFRVYLLGKTFKLVTDCSAIAKARAQKELIPKIARWYMKLNEFDFEVVHRPGTSLAHVDALSRAPNEPAAEVDTAGFVHRVFIEQEDWLYSMQLQDERLKHIILVLREEIKDDQAPQYKQEYKLVNSRLYRIDDGLKFVVPKAVRWRIVKACHDDLGHFGADKTIARVKKSFWFPKIRKYVKEYINACVECCYTKARGGKLEGQLHIAEVDPVPFATLHLDHLGPFPKSARGMTHVLAISDAFTKFLVIKPVRSTKTVPVIAALLDLTSYFGLPKRVITDRGTAFTSKTFAEFCNVNYIRHIQTAVRTPRANGQVERANKIILSSLRAADGKPKDWDLQLRAVQWAVNSQENSTTGYSPNSLIFDFSLRDIVHNKMIAVLQDEDDIGNEQPSMNEKRREAAQNITLAREKWKQYFDRKHATPIVYDVDELVLVAHEPPATGESRKLEPKFKGPYVIAKVLGNDRYLVTDVPGMQLTQKPFESVFSSDKLKKWCSDSPCLEADDVDAADSDSDPCADNNAIVSEARGKP